VDRNEQLRSLPKVSDLLEREDVAGLLEAEPRSLVTESLRRAVEACRARVLAGDEAPVSADEVVTHAHEILVQLARPSLRRVVNASGIVVHTNLGRSPLPLDAVAAIVEIAGGYSTLEYDAESGERGSRHVHVESLLRRLTGAEAAMAVNNNAAAVLLGLAGLSAGREAIVSRGQLVEIGGSFRIPDIMSQSGARMVEVGSTNKTHLSDYEGAITARTGLLLKVHSSNFRLVGFTQEVPLSELVELGRTRGIPVFEDQGSGVLLDLSPWGLPGEPTIGSAIEAGADLVSASGDKLLGGPQAGILVGSAEVIGRLKKHPLARALRLDKLTLAALEATLRLYLDPDRAVREIPTIAMLVASAEEMRARAEALAGRISQTCGPAAEVQILADVSRAGGGALPMTDIPTFVVALSAVAMGPVELERELRGWEPPIVSRIHEDRIHLDPRTLSADDEDIIVEALGRLLARL
jgi:L-seryl-tRNA(Ser) seleniumtransferase